MIVQAQKLPLLNHPETRLNFYPHQAVMLDEWEKHRTFLSETNRDEEDHWGGDADRQ